MRLHAAAMSGLLALACSHTTILRPTPQSSRAPADEQTVRTHTSTAATLGIPPGHLPGPGECRVWIPGRPPGHQPKPKSRSCSAMAATAPAGSWIVYRPTADRKLVHVRVVDDRRPGVVVRVQVFDIESKRLLREEQP